MTGQVENKARVVMQISKEQYRALVRNVVNNMKRLEFELGVYKMAVSALKKSAPQLDFDELLSKIRNLPEMRDRLERKYAEYQKKEFELIDREEESQELLKFLQEWSSDEPIN